VRSSPTDGLGLSSSSSLGDADGSAISVAGSVGRGETVNDGLGSMVGTTDGSGLLPVLLGSNRGS
jgi:hypothetical protein